MTDRDLEFWQDDRKVWRGIAYVAVPLVVAVWAVVTFLFWAVVR